MSKLIDFEPGTSRHKLLQTLAANGGFVPSRSSVYNLTRGIVAGALGAPTLNSDRAPAYEHILERSGFVECDRADMPNSMGIRLTKLGREALAEADHVLASADSNSPWELGKRLIKVYGENAPSIFYCDSLQNPQKYPQRKKSKCQFVLDGRVPNALVSVYDHRFSHMNRQGGKRKTEFVGTLTAEEAWWLNSNLGDLSSEDLVQLVKLTLDFQQNKISEAINYLKTRVEAVGRVFLYTIEKPILGDEWAYGDRRVNRFQADSEDARRAAVDYFIEHEQNSSNTTHFKVQLPMKFRIQYP